MNRNWTLLTKVSIHPLFWFVIAIGLITGYFKELVILFIIVFVHEMGHAITALFFDWRIKKIELLPFGGVVEVDEHGNRPLKEELFVVIMGPLQHIVLFIAAFLLYQFQLIDTTTYETFLLHNFMIFSLNLLPIWPLDGGKLLFILLSSFHAFSKAHRLALLFSCASLLLFTLFSVIGFPFHLNLLVIFAFLIVAHYTEWKQRHFVHIRFLLERYYGKHRDIKKIKPISVDENVTLSEVILKFCRGCKHQIIVKKQNNEQLTLDENEILHAFFAEKKTSHTIGEIFG